MFLRMLNLYYQLRGINDCPSVGFDMASNSCPHEKVIRCLCVRVMTGTAFKKVPAAADDETPKSAGKIAQTQFLCCCWFFKNIFYCTLFFPTMYTNADRNKLIMHIITWIGLGCIFFSGVIL